MEAGFIALGILSIVYYLFILFRTKRANSTFSWFWIVYGIWNMILAIVVKITPDWFDTLVSWMTTLVMIVFFVVEILILCAMVSMPQKNAKYIIILGAKLREQNISGTLKRRLDKAICYLQENPGTVCVVAGGNTVKNQNPEISSISEAKAMSEYLLNHGIDRKRIRIEEKSKTTLENLLFSRPLIRGFEDAKIGIVTNNYHIYRAMKMAKTVGYKKAFPIPVGTDFLLWFNYMTREFFAFFAMFIQLRKVNLDKDQK